jgi:hypothetical protein
MNAQKQWHFLCVLTTKDVEKIIVSIQTAKGVPYELAILRYFM